MDGDPPDDSIHGVRYELCWGKINEKLAKSVEGIRGGAPEPKHFCANCSGLKVGHRIGCGGYVGRSVVRAY